MSGLFCSPSHSTAPKGQACAQLPQPMHNSAFKRTPPPGRRGSASVGQTRAHGGSGQARQTMTTKPLRTPPAERTQMLDAARPPLPERRAQANTQDWQPTQRSLSSSASRFAILLSKLKGILQVAVNATALSRAKRPAHQPTPAVLNDHAGSVTVRSSSAAAEGAAWASSVGAASGATAASWGVVCPTTGTPATDRCL